MTARFSHRAISVLALLLGGSWRLVVAPVARLSWTTTALLRRAGCRIGRARYGSSITAVPGCDDEPSCGRVLAAMVIGRHHSAECRLRAPEKSEVSPSRHLFHFILNTAGPDTHETGESNTRNQLTVFRATHSMRQAATTRRIPTELSIAVFMVPPR